MNFSASNLVDVIDTSGYSWGPNASPKGEEGSEKLLRNVSGGGLIDIFISSPAMLHQNLGLTERHVQLMHQTVKEFVIAPGFRHLVLGRIRAEVTEENGHSFISKYLLALPDDDSAPAKQQAPERLLWHMRQAEHTTGTSQYDHLYKRLKSVELRYGITDPASFAVKSGLLLLLEDTYKHNPGCVQISGDRLLNSLVCGMQGDLLPEVVFKVAESLASKGWVVGPNGYSNLESLLGGMFLSKDHNIKQDRPDPCYARVALLVLDRLKKIDVMIPWKTSPSESYYLGAMIHLATPVIAARLLARGASPNALTYGPKKLSPLDHIIHSTSVHPPSVSYLYGLAHILLRYGGKPYTTTGKEWGVFLMHLSMHGFDVDSDLWHPYPLGHGSPELGGSAGTMNISPPRQYLAYSPYSQTAQRVRLVELVPQHMKGRQRRRKCGMSGRG